MVERESWSDKSEGNDSWIRICSWFFIQSQKDVIRYGMIKYGNLSLLIKKISYITNKKALRYPKADLSIR